MAAWLAAVGPQYGEPERERLSGSAGQLPDGAPGSVDFRLLAGGGAGGRPSAAGRAARDHPLRTALAGGLTPLVARGTNCASSSAGGCGPAGGMGSVLLLSGEAGIGKSRLIQELCDTPSRRERLCLQPVLATVQPQCLPSSARVDAEPARVGARVSTRGAVGTAGGGPEGARAPRSRRDCCCSDSSWRCLRARSCRRCCCQPSSSGSTPWSCWPPSCCGCRRESPGRQRRAPCSSSWRICTGPTLPPCNCSTSCRSASS